MYRIRLLLVTMCLLGTSGFSQGSKILITQTACVDIPKILNAVYQDSKLWDFLLASEEENQEKSFALKKRIQELEDYLSVNQTNLAPEIAEEIVKEIEYQRSEWEKFLLTETQSSNVEEIILTGIYRLIKEIAEQEGLSIIIEKSSAVIYNKPEVDITDKVIQIMSAKSESE